VVRSPCGDPPDRFGRRARLSAAELVDHFIEHRERRRHSTRARAAPSASGSSRPITRARAKTSRSSRAVLTSGAVDQPARGDVTGMPSWIVTPYGCSGGVQWIATRDTDVSRRASSVDRGTRHVDRLLVHKGFTDDRRPLAFVDPGSSRRLDVCREPVIPGEQKVVRGGVVRGGGEAWPSGLLRHHGEMRFGLAGNLPPRGSAALEGGGLVDGLAAALLAAHQVLRLFR
jgi:hypothetical protein